MHCTVDLLALKCLALVLCVNKTLLNLPSKNIKLREEINRTEPFPSISIPGDDGTCAYLGSFGHGDKSKWDVK
jgi:hypothetical protein